MGVIVDDQDPVDPPTGHFQVLGVHKRGAILVGPLEDDKRPVLLVDLRDEPRACEARRVVPARAQKAVGRVEAVLGAGERETVLKQLADPCPIPGRPGLAVAMDSISHAFLRDRARRVDGAHYTGAGVLGNRLDAGRR
jgi:hypothetical protein